MNVSFAVQVLSSTDVNVLRNYYKEKTHSTAEFCEYMNKFFHCLNVRNQINDVKKRKSFLQPYTNLNDECFKLFKNDFLQYLLNWKKNIIDRPGNFSQTEKHKMFLSWQACEGRVLLKQPTIVPLTTDPPTTHPPTNRPVVITYVKTEDQTSNMFCIL